jgi:hypothetical protein
MTTLADRFIYEQCEGLDEAQIMTALDAAGIPSDQDWEQETTIWTFSDDSKVFASGPDLCTL